MSPTDERRHMILEHMQAYRKDTVANLAAQFQVSERTIRTDLLDLSCDYPIETRRGKHGGGVYYTPMLRPMKESFSEEERQVLDAVFANLGENQKKVMNRILYKCAEKQYVAR